MTYKYRKIINTTAHQCHNKQQASYRVLPAVLPTSGGSPPFSGAKAAGRTRYDACHYA